MREISNQDYNLMVEALTRYVRQPPSGASLKEENLMRRVRVMLKRFKKKVK